MKLAIFDIDGTLVPGSTERRFWRYLVAQGRQGPRQILAYAWFLVRYLPRYGLAVFKKNKAYLSGLAVEDIDALANEFVVRRVLPELYGPVVRRLEHHRRSGDTLVLLSGTLEPIAQALARALDVEHVYGTLCAERAGRYTAQPPLRHPFGTTKLLAAMELAAALDTDLHEASAYGDSRHDLPLLRGVGKAVAIRPDAPLIRVAYDNAWEILDGEAPGRPVAD
jgi:HAD superfamily hydrolase (TIGR01490 family)